VFSNDETGGQIEVSLKATDSSAYIEHSLARYPDIPIIATDEVVESMGDNHMIWAAGVTNDELNIVVNSYCRPACHSYAFVLVDLMIQVNERNDNTGPCSAFWWPVQFVGEMQKR